MSDKNQSEENKSQEPTQQKIQKAREKGDVPYSMEATSAATYAAFFLMIIAMSGWIGGSLFSALMPFFSKPDAVSAILFSSTDNGVVFDLVFHVSKIILLIFLILIVTIFCSVAAQHAFTFSPSKVKPKLSRISLLDNIKQKYGINGLSEFVKRAAKLSAILAIIIFAFRDRFFELHAMAGLPARGILQHLQTQAVFFVGLVTAAAMIIGAVDLPWRYFQHRRQLRMTYDEVKKENKETEGDPILKSARRQRAEMLATNRMMADVPKADIVIVNPTHYATALKWNRDDGFAPICVAKGVDEVAAQIRKTAAEHGVPIKRDAPTARSIYALVDIGSEIKREHFAAVAAAIHYADQMRKKWTGGNHESK